MDIATDWFRKYGWGIFLHYCGAPPSSSGGAELSSEEWNAQVDAFDVNGLKEQLRGAQVPYFFIMQKGGVVTWDVPIRKDGLIPDAFVRQIRTLGATLDR